MRLSEFNFVLPKELVATRPAVPRSDSKLLTYKEGRIEDLSFFQLPSQLRSGDLLVFNNTRVIPALITGILKEPNLPSEKGKRFEFLLIRKLGKDLWLCWCKPSKKLELQKQIIFSEKFFGKAVRKQKDGVVIKFEYSGNFFKMLEKDGQMPLPPYIRKYRSVDDRDKNDYQPIFSSVLGSIASPTASLHFDQRLLKVIREAAIQICFVTLHVGVGTFSPIRTEIINEHQMHSETGEINEDTARIINNVLASGKRVIPVGTTSLRILESSVDDDGKLTSFKGSTNIYITPGFKFKIASGLITNFHLPKSSLFILIAAFIGLESAKDIYSHAIKNKYRFYSYGDASLLIP